MRTRPLALAAAGILTAASLTGCITQLGPRSTASPEIGDVTGVVLDTYGDLEITEGEPSLTIHAPRAVLDRLTTDVRDGVLTLGQRGGPMIGNGSNIRYELTVPDLDRIEVNGAGDVEASVSGESLTIEISGAGDVSVDGIDASEVVARVSGSGDIELDGTAQTVEAEISGMGDIDADDLEVADAAVTVAGTGDATLWVTGTLRAEISGVGTVRHRGGAEVDADITGLGGVEADD
jgi:hypothetical protein